MSKHKSRSRAADVRAQRAAVTIVYQETDAKINGEPVLRGIFDLVLPP